MPLKPVTYYTAECDHCGRDLLADSDYGAYSDITGLKLDAEHYCGAKVVDDRWWCSSCVHPYWSNLDGDDWDDFHDNEPEAIEKFVAWLANNRKERAA